MILSRIERKLNLVIALLGEVLRKERRIMATIDQVLQDVTDESTLEDSIITLLQGVQKQLADALANTTIPADVQAKIDSVFAGLEANKAKVAAAVTANTPASNVNTSVAAVPANSNPKYNT